MSLFSHLAAYLARRKRTRVLTNAVRDFTRRHYPQDIPLWSFVAEDRKDECVVYTTYRRSLTGRKNCSHRFFRVSLPDRAVTVLTENYVPSQWGPFR